MKLYSYDFAPNPRRVLLHMRHKGIEIDTLQVDLMKGEQMSGEFAQLNPQFTVPLLVLADGNSLGEVVSIVSYLEDLYPEKPLLGTNSLERAQILGWCHRIFMQGLTAVAEVFRNGNPAFVDRAMPGPVNMPQLPELVERGNLRLDAFFASMEQELQDRDYLVADGLSQADIDLYVAIGFAGWAAGRKIPESCPRLHEWTEGMRRVFGEEK